MPSLTIEYPPGNKRQLPISGPKVTIGRKPDNDIVIGEPFVSGRHAEFRRLPDGSYQLVDLQSHNGTLINGDRIKMAPLSEGDVLTFGMIDGRFHVGDAPTSVSLKAATVPMSAPQTEAMMAPTQRIRPAQLTPAPLQPPGAELAKATQLLTAARVVLAALQKETATAMVDAEGARKILAELRGQIAKASPEAEEAAGKLKALLAEVAAAETRKKSLQAEAEKARTEAEAHRQQLSAAESKFKELRESTEEMRRQEQALTERLQTLHRQQFVLEQRLKADTPGTTPA